MATRTYFASASTGGSASRKQTVPCLNSVNDRCTTTGSHIDMHLLVAERQPAVLENRHSKINGATVAVGILDESTLAI